MIEGTTCIGRCDAASVPSIRYPRSHEPSGAPALSVHRMRRRTVRELPSFLSFRTPHFQPFNPPPLSTCLAGQRMLTALSENCSNPCRKIPTLWVYGVSYPVSRCGFSSAVGIRGVGRLYFRLSVGLHRNQRVKGGRHRDRGILQLRTSLFLPPPPSRTTGTRRAALQVDAEIYGAGPAARLGPRC